MTRNNQPRDGWSRVRFGDVVLNSTAVSRDPAGEGFTRYIIGKHIDGRRPRVESWGDVGDPDFGPRIRTVFLPGDVICTTRGPKLKVATVDFRGLGAHTNFVLRTQDPEVLLQPYLEVIGRSEAFHHHLAKHFRGSVNLFVNWSDAATYEFDLPPVEEQRARVRLFESSQALVESAETLARDAWRLERSFLASEMNALTTNAGVQMVSIGESGETMMGRQRSPDYVTGTYSCPYLRVANVFDDHIDTSDVLEMDFAPGDRTRYELQPGDILLNEGQSLELLGRCAMYRGGLAGTVCFQNTLIRYRAKKTTPQFALAWMRHLFYSGVFSSLGSKTTSIAHLGLKKFAALPFPLPERHWEAAFVERFESLRESRVSAERRLTTFADTVHRAIHRRIIQGSST